MGSPLDTLSKLAISRDIRISRTDFEGLGNGFNSYQRTAKIEKARANSSLGSFWDDSAIMLSLGVVTTVADEGFPYRTAFFLAKQMKDAVDPDALCLFPGPTL